MNPIRDHPPRVEDVNMQFFDQFAEAYESWAGGLHVRVAARLVEFADPQPGEACLDVGCGTGLVAAGVADRVGARGEVVGIDVSRGMLAVARRRSRPNSALQRISADHHLWFKDGSFDLVTFGNSLAYLSHPFQTLEEARRVLRKGGRVALALRMRSLATAAQEVFYGILDDLTEALPVIIPRPADGRGPMGEPAVIRELLLDAGFAAVKTTMMVTGARMPSATAWVDLMEGAGPRPHALLNHLGPGIRKELEAAVDRQMGRLGEDAYHYHEAFTFTLATR